MPNVVTADQLQQQLTSQFIDVKNKTTGVFGGLLAQANHAYERRWHNPMPVSKQQMLMQAFHYLEQHPPVPGASKEAILSAAQDVAKVDNPLSFMMAMMSIIIPNFAYTEVVGIQNMPTKESPVFIPQISATEARGSYQPGDSLLGATNWGSADNYTTNQFNINSNDPGPLVTVAASGSVGSYTYTVTMAGGGIVANIVPGSVFVTVTGATVGAVATVLTFQDDGKGGWKSDPYLASGAINYTTGAATLVLAGVDNTASAFPGVASVFFVTDPDSIPGQNTIDGPSSIPYGRQAPAQVTLEWQTTPVVAVPYRVRSQYSLDNYYAAKQVLNGYDIDQVMATSLAGLINKEISGNVFSKMLREADAGYSWNSTPPTGVSWVIHRLSILELFVSAKNGIRQNIQRCGGNVAVVGTGLINQIETLDSTIYTPQKYASEPIGPYVHGTFINGVKVLKHQQTGWEDTGFMAYKSSDVDASVIGGSYIALYATPSLVLDTLTSVQGLGTQLGFKKIFDNSIVRLGITGNWQDVRP